MGVYPKAKPLKREQALDLLAKLIKDETGAEIDPAALGQMFERRWDRLSDLAHAAHREQREPNGVDMLDAPGALR